MHTFYRHRNIGAGMNISYVHIKEMLSILSENKATVIHHPKYPKKERERERFILFSTYLFRTEKKRTFYIYNIIEVCEVHFEHN